MNTQNNFSPDDTLDWFSERTVEQIWKALDGKVARSVIEQVISEIALKYVEARIKTFIPILVQKEAVARLKTGLSNTPSDAINHTKSELISNTQVAHVSVPNAGSGLDTVPLIPA